MDALTEIVTAPDQRRKGLLSRGLFGSLQTFLIIGMFMFQAPLLGIASAADTWNGAPQKDIQVAAFPAGSCRRPNIARTTVSRSNLAFPSFLNSV